MLPSLSIAIATWNRAPLLRRTLAGLCNLRLPMGLKWEVLVCDNNSTDDTAAVLRACAAELADKVPLRCLFEPRQGKSLALNQMVAAATGDWLLFLDDDVLVDEGWLEGYLAGMARYPKAGCLGGPIRPWVEQALSPRQAFLLRAFPAVFGVLEVNQDRPMDLRSDTAWGANMALRRGLMPPTGFCAEQGMIGKERIAGEDVGMVGTLLASGHEGWLLADAGVGHWVEPAGLNARRLCHWQAGMGRNFARKRGRPAPGRFGVAWWAWREVARRWLRAGLRWRPYPTLAFYQALGEAAQYHGFVRGGR